MYNYATTTTTHKKNLYLFTLNILAQINQIAKSKTKLEQKIMISIYIIEINANIYYINFSCSNL